MPIALTKPLGSLIAALAIMLLAVAPAHAGTKEQKRAENALAERMNGILKQEYGLGLEFGIKADARRAVDQGVWLYNTQRPHTALDYQTPAQVHQAGLN